LSKSRGFRIVFYPFILMDDGGKSWRGRIGYESADVSSGADTAVSNFLGSAATSQFTQDFTNKTVSYSGSSTDYTYRRMILHYANLCVVAGGVDLFLIGSELRSLESIRGSTWAISGGGPPATWDYPFVNGLVTLSYQMTCGASLTLLC
jgi:GTA TIM-barrel-like domain